MISAACQTNVACTARGLNLAAPMVWDTGGAALTNAPIHDAAQQGDVVECQRIIRLDSSQLDKKGWRNWTPLIWAARENQPAVVTLLLDAGADVDAQTDDGWTALHSAASCGFASCVQLLCDGGADVFLKDTEEPSLVAVGGKSLSVYPSIYLSNLI